MAGLKPGSEEGCVAGEQSPAFVRGADGCTEAPEGT